MSFQRFFFITVLLISHYCGTDAQVRPETILVNEMGDLQCEFLWASLDVFRAEMIKNPDSFGTVEISGTIGDPRSNFYWESFIKNHLTRFTPGRWEVRRTAVGSDRRVRFWLTPRGADPPKINVSVWSFVYPSGTEPFIFTNDEDYSVKTGVCLYVDEIRLLAKALQENPQARLNVVLIVPSNQTYRRRRAKAVRMLTKEYLISPSRIRFFEKLDTKPDPHGIEPDAEYWFVP